MKDHLILQDFTGTQDGIRPAEKFTAGTVRPLSASLVAALGGTDGGFVKEADVAAKEIAKAPPQVAEAVLGVVAEAEGTPAADDAARDVEDRETKVVAPDETKPDKPNKTKKK